MGDGVGVPPFGEHGDRDDTPNPAAERTRLADGVHHLAEQVLVGKIGGVLLAAGALHDLPPEALDLGGGHGAEAGVEGVARFELLAVDEERVGLGEWLVVAVEVAEQRQPPVFDRCRAVGVLPLKPRDVVEDELRNRGVLADDDEAGGHLDLALLPELERLVVMAVEGMKGRLEPGGELERIEAAGRAAPLLRHVGADVLPEHAKHRHLVAGDVFGDRHARELHDPTLDRVHERKIAHCPGEERPFGVARALEEEGSGGEVEDARHAELAIENLEPGDPDAGFFVVLLGFLAVVPLERLVVVVKRLRAVAVVGFVVDDQDVLHPHEVGHDPLEHLPLGLLRLEIRAAAAFEQAARPRRHLHPLPEHEGVVVGDHDLGPLHVFEHVAGNKLAGAVVVVGIVGEEDAEPVLDRQARRDDEKAAGEVLAAGAADGVHRLPGDEHRHHGCFPGPGGELEGEAVKAGVGVVVGAGEIVEDPLPGGRAGRDFRQPDRRLGRFDLAEERPNAGKLVRPPMLQEPGGLWGDAPLAGFELVAPHRDFLANLVDDRHRLILLLRRRQPLPLVEDDVRLRLLLPLPLLRLGDRRDKRRPSALLDDLQRGLAVGVELPVARRGSVG